MTNLIISPNTTLSENSCVQMRETLGQPEQILTLPPVATSTFSTLNRIQVTTFKDAVSPLTLPLIALKPERQADLALLLLRVSSDFSQHPRDSHSSVYLFADGHMFVYWSGIILGKNYFDEDSSEDVLTSNIHIEFSGQTHHEKMRFLKGVQHVLTNSSHFTDTPHLTFLV
jgi:hypothetical protein